MDKKDDEEVVMEGELDMDEVWKSLPEFDPQHMSLIAKLDEQEDELYREILALRSMAHHLATKIMENKRRVYDRLQDKHERVETQSSRDKVMIICKMEEELVAAEIDSPRKAVSNTLKRFLKDYLGES